MVEGDGGERLRGGLVEADGREQPLSKLVGYNILATERSSAPACFSFQAAPTTEINVPGGRSLKREYTDLSLRDTKVGPSPTSKF
jgi:hypothetical protein